MSAVSDLLPHWTSEHRHLYKRAFNSWPFATYNKNSSRMSEIPHTFLGTRVLEVVWYTGLKNQEVLEAVELPWFSEPGERSNSGDSVAGNPGRPPPGHLGQNTSLLKPLLESAIPRFLVLPHYVHPQCSPHLSRSLSSGRVPPSSYFAMVRICNDQRVYVVKVVPGWHY